MQSTTSSTRTFMTPPAAEPKTAKEPPRRTRRRLSRKSLPWLCIAILLGATGFLFVQYRTAQAKLAEGSSSGQQLTALINKVRKLVVVPAGETPTVATVMHADRLKGQTFFANALNGDKVLVYNHEKEAILYRPSTNQIVTIAPVTVTPNGSSIKQ